MNPLRKIVLKVQWRDELRRLPVNTDTVTFGEVSTLLNETFTLPACWSLRYQDDEGDDIRVTTQDEFKEALAIASREGRKSLKMHVIELEQPQAATPQPKETSCGTTNIADILSMFDKNTANSEGLPDPEQLKNLVQSFAPMAMPFLETFLANHGPQEQGHCATVSPKDQAPVEKDASGVLHANIICDGCEGNSDAQALSRLNGTLDTDTCTIRGIRYKSASVNDFDLCGTCEASLKYETTHGPFLKIRTPGNAPAIMYATFNDGRQARTNGMSFGGNCGGWRRRGAPGKGTHCRRNGTWRGQWHGRRQGGANGGTVLPDAPWLRVTELSLPEEFLTFGSQGEDVSKLQYVLIALGHLRPGAIKWCHGNFGPRTRDAISNFQKSNLNEHSTGEYDAVTRDALQMQLTLLQSQVPSDSEPTPKKTHVAHVSGPVTAAPAVSAAPAAEGRPMARFIKDVTLHDGTTVKPGEKLDKTWRLRNDGSAPWPKGIKLRPVGGDDMQAEPVEVPAAAPGQEVDVTVKIVAPALAGRYVAYYRLELSDGARFGHRVWADIVVAKELEPADTTPVEAKLTPTTAAPVLEQAVSQAQKALQAPNCPVDTTICVDGAMAPPAPTVTLTSTAAHTEASSPQSGDFVLVEGGTPESDAPRKEVDPKPATDPKEKYANQIQLLHGMGFYSDEEILPPLIKWNGDVNRVVHDLCNA